MTENTGKFEVIGAGEAAPNVELGPDPLGKDPLGNEFVPDEELPPFIPSGTRITRDQLNKTMEDMERTKEYIFSSDAPDHVAGIIVQTIHEQDAVLSPLQIRAIHAKVSGLLHAFGHKFNWSSSYDLPPGE